MPFMFKLSRRWAGLRAVVVMGTLVVAACELRRAIASVDEVARLELSPSAETVQPNQTLDFTAVAFTAASDTAETNITWNATGGSITDQGRQGGRHLGQYRNGACGSFQVTATSRPSNKSDTASVSVTCPASVASVTVSPAQASVDTGKTVQLTATPRDANGNALTGRVITWASGNPAAATVSGSGLVRGVTAGSATITATSEGQSGTSAITVVAPPPPPPPVPVASVTVSPAQASVDTGKTVQLTATLRDANGNALTGRVITWASGTPAAATVSGSGLVRGVTAGSATITATSEGQSGTSAITVTVPPPPGSGEVLVGAGDIAGCSSSGDEATAALLDGIAGTVFTAGDNVYDSGTASEFANCYDPTWGRHKARTRPSPGNHDYNTSGATGYYNYFGASAGPSGRGYYSYDLGDWHLVSLNSNISMSAGSTQEQWLRADLAANPKRCVLAYWHHPRFSSGSHGSSTSPQPLWQALYDFDADVVIVGHDHNYQRFAPQTPTGVADAARGIRQFVAGMGGRSHYNFGTPIANTEAYNTDTDGVLKLTLFADSYTWEFIPVAGKTYTDSGTGSCH
jgi:uncharacterized protein YjdB